MHVTVCKSYFKKVGKNHDLRVFRPCPRASNGRFVSPTPEVPAHCLLSCFNVTTLTVRPCLASKYKHLNSAWAELQVFLPGMESLPRSDPSLSLRTLLALGSASTHTTSVLHPLALGEDSRGGTLEEESLIPSPASPRTHTCSIEASSQPTWKTQQV